MRTKGWKLIAPKAKAWRKTRVSPILQSISFVYGFQLQKKNLNTIIHKALQSGPEMAKGLDAVGIEPTTFHMRSENHTPRPGARSLIKRFYLILDRYLYCKILLAATSMGILFRRNFVGQSHPLCTHTVISIYRNRPGISFTMIHLVTSEATLRSSFIKCTEKHKFIQPSLTSAKSHTVI